MRVIFTGQTGINCDSEVLKNLELFCKEGNNPTEGLKLYSLSEELERLKVDMISFLDCQNPQSKADIWKRAFNKILSKVKNEDPKQHFFLSIHHVFYRYSSFFSPVEWDLIKEFQPDIFITLIDDLYSIWKRIKSRNEESPSESHFCLRELSSWRSAEILMTDLLAKSLSSSKKIIRNYVVAVKHPAQMLHGLIFKPEKLIVYTAFPITSSRGKSENVDEINNFRMKLHEKFIVFDPITIDEDILRILLKEQPLEKKTLLVSEKDRWPIPRGWSLCKDVDYPIELKANDALEVVQDLKDHIMLRDYRLIEQADCIAGYRPYYERQRSLGMFAEMTYARDVSYKRPYFVHFPDKDGEPKDSPFARLGVPFDTVENLIKTLQNIEKNKKITKGNNNF
jgi:hypothetical protein